MPELPHLQGLPSYHDLEHWDPFFRAVSEEQVVMCLHIGQGFSAINTPPDAPIDNLIILATQVSTLAAQDLLWGPAFKEFPDLKVAWSEAGIGWIPFYLNRCDRHYLNQTWLGHDFGDKLPSDIFRDHSLACYVTDPAALRIRDVIGVDIIAWECDYPHSDSIFPERTTMRPFSAFAIAPRVATIGPGLAACARSREAGAGAAKAARFSGINAMARPGVTAFASRR